MFLIRLLVIEIKPYSGELGHTVAPEKDGSAPMENILELAKRYDVRAPRYTSYPTAADFHEGIRPTEREEAISRTNHDPVPAPAALYLHLPFCHSLCFYCACNKVITRNAEKTHKYLDLIAKEAAQVAPFLDPDRRVTHVHLGGGSPTYYSPEQLGALMTALGKTFRMADPEEADWSIEVDPRTVSPANIRELRDLGFKRMSFGVQDLDPRVQQAINRFIEPDTLRSLVTAARDAGVESINFDLIYGLPHQDQAHFAHTLEQVIDMAPDRIALYGYAHLPNRFHAQRLLEGDALPTGMAKLGLLHNAIDTFCDAGYEYIGMDHFARPEDSLARSRREGTMVRNFQGYMHGPDTDLIGLGASAISSLGGTYCQNIKSVRLWGQAVEAGRPTIERGYRLTPEDKLRREVINAVMCKDVVRFEEFFRGSDERFEEHFSDALGQLEPLARDGLVRLFDDRIEITRLGRLFLRAIAMVFDEHLQSAHPTQRPVFSRVV